MTVVISFLSKAIELEETGADMDKTLGQIIGMCKQLIQEEAQTQPTGHALVDKQTKVIQQFQDLIARNRQAMVPQPDAQPVEKVATLLPSGVENPYTTGGQQ